MKLEDFDYPLPKELIAQKPLEKRDSSRLLVADRKTGALTGRNFSDIVEYFSRTSWSMLPLGNSESVSPAFQAFIKAAFTGSAEICRLVRKSRCAR